MTALKDGVIDQVLTLLKKIEALASNPHWTTNRRWEIDKNAVRAQQMLIDGIAGSKTKWTRK